MFRLVTPCRMLAAGLLAAATLTLGCHPPARAQDWPQHPVRILVPYAAGGNSDSMARLAAQRLSEAFGQQFVVENRVGGNGGIAGEAGARAPPDRYTPLSAVPPPPTIPPAMTKSPNAPPKNFPP